MLRRLKTSFPGLSIAYMVLIIGSDFGESTSSSIWPEPPLLNECIVQIDPNPDTAEIHDSDTYHSCDESNEEEEAAATVVTAAVTAAGSGQGATDGIRRRRGQGAGRPSRVIRRGRYRRNRPSPVEPSATIGGGVFKDIPMVTKYFGSIGLKETMVGVVAYKFYPNKTLLSDLTLVSYAVAFAALFAGNSTKATWPRLSNVLTEVGTDAAFAVVFGAIASHLPLYFGCVVFICWLVCAVCVRLQLSAAQSTNPPEPDSDSDSDA